MTLLRYAMGGLTAAVLFLGATSWYAAAGFHDFWIAPSTFRPSVGEVLDISLHVGHLARYTPYVRNPAHIRRFVAADADTLVTVRGTPGRDPAGTFVPDRPGLVVLGYRSHTSATELPAERFEAYLHEEGLDDVVAVRARRGEADEPGREQFSRCAKALVQVGGMGSEGFGRRLGFTLELVPVASPYDLAPGDTLTVQLLFRGRPLSGAQVVAVPRAAAQTPVRARTDAGGRVRLPLGHAGLWLLKSVYMLPVVGEPAADWESFWATLTFELPPAAP